ncbi:MAG: aromatic-ring-hydroxylating dioxygenase subunit beta [Burkholderiaceae bacterium]|jgi:3-phenylpropionate/cinnamic acid dioxygenase small subunit|nr:aromatic-ring-hydroxylating dioxygenase subunit beta [Burkholderiales bacterium]MCZ8102125.1 aromatic-ring-hydroxylating dioxygenase subunit beta [Burkholderiales bacterium]MCZ8339027.1 aromatic-ring-hydroxylating dioxygenase subunit beta [Burkholderiaceae bacterium]
MSTNQVGKALGTGVVIEAVESMTGAESIAPDHMGRGTRPSTQYVPDVARASHALQREVETFLYRQAALLDAKRWQEWIELFAEDGVYWMPVTPEQTDWLGEPSIFAEDRLLMEVRMGRLTHPNAWSQAAAWGTNHLVGNVVIEAVEGDTVRTYSRFQMMELRRDAVRHFGGSYRHTLRRVPGGGFRIALQRVDMMNGQAAYDYVLQAWT